MGSRTRIGRTLEQGCGQGHHKQGGDKDMGSRIGTGAEWNGDSESKVGMGKARIG